MMDLMKQIVLYSANIAQTYVGTTPKKGTAHVPVEEREESLPESPQGQ